MGVRGLQTFLKNNPTLSQNVDLANTSLVIDANNLLCLLFCSPCQVTDSPQWRSDIYGGDMVAYAETVRGFFKSLDQCNITPILVFDGSVIGKQSTSDQVVLKDKAIYQRGVERFTAAKLMSEENIQDSIIMPQTINHVFKNIASDLGIQRIQTPYEADTHIARIANDLNCPVLTNDSDFLIYSLPQGFAMIDLFRYKNLTDAKSGGKCIPCVVFSQDRLIRCLPGLRPDNMPLLSVLLGNDYVEAGTFDRVLEYICRVPYHGPLEARTFTHKRIANLLTWLKNKSHNTAVDYVLSQLHAGNRDKIRQLISTLLRNYKIEETDNFEAELEDVYPKSKADPQMNVHPELMPPTYLRRLMETADLTPLALDMVFHNTSYNYAIIDDFALPSSSFVKYRPFSLAVTLLRPNSYQGMATYRRQVESERDTFYTFDRRRDEYIKIRIGPMETLENFGSVEHLNCYQMITLDPALKKSILQTTFGFNTDELNLLTDTLARVFSGPFVHDACICIMLVRYIGLETKTNPKPQFVDALVLTLFYYAALNGQLNKTSCQDEHYGQLLLRLRPHSMSNNGRRYEPSPSLYRRVMHFISQLQSAYVAYCLLNSLLNQVFPVPRYERFLNGPLIFRLTKLLRLGELKMSSICQELPVLNDISSSIRLISNCDE